MCVCVYEKWTHEDTPEHQVSPDAKAALIAALQAKVSEQHEWGVKAWNNIQRLNDRIVELEVERGTLQSQLTTATAELEAVQDMSSNAKRQVEGLKERLAIAAQDKNRQFQNGFEEGVRAKGISNPELSRKLRELETDNSVLRQRLVRESERERKREREEGRGCDRMNICVHTCISCPVSGQRATYVYT